MFRKSYKSLMLLVVGASCSQPVHPPVREVSIPDRPVIYVRTADGGLVPEQQAGDDDLRDSRWRSGEGLPEAVRLRYSRPVGKGPPPIDRTTAEPIYPQTYYVRPEHTSTGYIEGRYGRTGDFTPGEHTSREYIPGHYRGDGTYTRPEHTPSGYIPGHYRAVPQPGNPASQIGARNP
ncbi:MAG TPA: hypothetical protein VJZ71_02265 [Phycisphaerae bacterium]|nr:hypothetical protein [Phycisphaerae bacterium]